MSDGICPYCHGTGWNDAERDRMARLVMRDAYLRVRSWLVDEIKRLERDAYSRVRSWLVDEIDRLDVEIVDHQDRHKREIARYRSALWTIANASDWENDESASERLATCEGLAKGALHPEATDPPPAGEEEA